ncbi:unnamed protein product [Cylicocyclus nassatus]|uniref:Uncharacterized protein n=1 Tax=Cylicocyclus nassatus TaxID=53992 RepID=A0AA36H181_CYLNA|nr:unnamed protein product [Cylicocyclus nassatus]
MLVFAAYPTEQDIEEFKNLAYHINTNGFSPFFVASLYPEGEEEFTQSRVLIAACVNLVFNLICEITGLANFLPFLFAWSPVLNPAAVLYFVRELWRPLQKLLPFSKVVPIARETTTDIQGARNQPKDYRLRELLIIYPLLFVNKFRMKFYSR